MPSDKSDAVGALITAYYLGNESFEVIESRNGSVHLSQGAPLYFAPYEDWPEHVQAVIDLAHGRVLDIGCGAGRIALHLQEKGMEVIGIDVSEGALRVCRARGVKDARYLSLRNVRVIGKDEIDTFIMCGNGFGLFGTPEDAVTLLRRMGKVARRGALLLVESRDPGKRSEGIGKITRLRVRFLSYATPWFNWLVVAPDEMELLARQAGWILKEVKPAGSSSYYMGVLRFEGRSNS